MRKRTVVGQWLERHFLAWQNTTGERQTMAAAKRWANGKSIVLADDREIGRLVESAYSRR